MRDRGICLDAQSAFTRGPQTLQQALLDVLMPGRRVATLVGRPAGGDGEAMVGQITRRNSDPYARLIFIGPPEALDDAQGLRMLDALSAAAGESGAHHLLAEVDEKSDAFVGLRRGGFAVYARQRIWRLRDEGLLERASAKEDWKAEEKEDHYSILNLYHAVVPPLVQQVEPAPGNNRKGMVYMAEGEALGYMDTAHGPLGTWVHPYFHPAAEESERLLAEFLGELDARRETPVYFCVRSYQSWINGVLSHLAFEPLIDQAVMVKHLVAAIKRPAFARLPSLDGTRPEPTVPFAPLEKQKSTPRGR
jgi:hypothetical protein